MDIRTQLAILANDYGIQFMVPPQAELPRHQGRNGEAGPAYSMAMAMDAQPTLVTAPDGGIPWYLVNFLDPEIIRVLVTPMKAVEIVGEVKKGDWTTRTTQFPVIEATGGVTAYGDYNNGGNSGANPNWINRQSFHFQTITQWGEQELDTMGEARIDWAAQLNFSSVLNINKFANKMAFFGIANLLNYGLLNDPSLPTPIAPEANGSGGGTTWATKDGGAIYQDISDLYIQLVSQTKGLIDRDTPMTLALSPTSEGYFTRTNQYNVNVSDQIKKNFPNMRVVTAPEYSTASGELMQMIVDRLDGVKTAEVAITEKLRAHPVKVGLSAFKQKKSAGGWGTIIKRPFCIAQMRGM